MATEYRKRARSPTPESDLSDGEWPVPFGSPLGSPVDAVPGGEDNEASRPAPKYHRAPSPEREYLCTLPPTCAQPGTSQRFATQAALDAHQVRLHRWVCRVAVRDKPGRVGEGAQIVLPDGVPAALALPEHFSGRNPGGRGKGQKWRECGKIFPDGRLLDLVRARRKGRGDGLVLMV